MYRILVIDDNEAIHADFRKVLLPVGGSSGALSAAKAALFGTGGASSAGSPERPIYELSFAVQGAEGLACVQTAASQGRPFALAFVDMRMPPGWDGLETIERLWAVDPNLQIVICSAYSDNTWEEITERLGLTDRLLILKKPFDAIEVAQLAAALTEKWELGAKAAMRMEELEDLVRQRTQELSHAATHDRLTGLPNRGMLLPALTEAVSRSLDTGGSYAVYFLDFDRFKVVNDSLGHDAGDELLVEIARRLERTLDAFPEAASQHLVARFGGDEFVVILTGITCPQAIRVIAQRLLDAVAVPFRLKGHDIITTASIGITSSDYRHASAEEALRNADVAMYHAKAAGKDRFVVFDQPMHNRVIERLGVEQALHGALARREFVLHYQPIVAVESGEIRGLEALLRWARPGHGLVAPAAFIHVAEEAGLIVPIGQWVLREACRQLSVWQKRPEWSSLFMTVNVSARQLVSDAIVTHVREAIEDAGVDPTHLAIEITESAVIADPDHVGAILRQLRDIGVGILVDDFGAGYTSLRYLHRLPVSGLKIDREFVETIGENRGYAAIVHALIGLAQNLNIGVIAEGIESSEQLAMLQALDCECVQGFLLGRPAPPCEVETRWLGKHARAPRAA